jgi:hypothetical protein
MEIAEVASMAMELFLNGITGMCFFKSEEE